MPVAYTNRVCHPEHREGSASSVSVGRDLVAPPYFVSEWSLPTHSAHEMRRYKCRGLILPALTRRLGLGRVLWLSGRGA